MKKNIKSILVIFFLSIFFTGCIGVNSDFKDIRNNVIDLVGHKVKKKIEIGIGAAGLALAGSFVRFAEEDDLPADIISYLSSVQVGIYENFYYHENNTAREFSNFCSKISDLGWQYIVRSYEKENFTLVFVKNDLIEGINEMLVITNNDSELVIATMEGELEEIVAVAIRNKDFGIVMVND